jgi:septal ring factor EnvC (AmiA/AmiB activator)
VIEKTEEQLETYAEEVNDVRKRIIDLQYEKNKLEKEILEYEKQIMTEE